MSSHSSYRVIVFFYFSITGYIQVTQRSNVKEPVWIDTTDPLDQWANGSVTAGSFDLILSINILHIAEWAAAEVSSLPHMLQFTPPFRCSYITT